MSRPNICIKDEDGNEQWISRSVVVVPVVFTKSKDSNCVFTLIEQRGKAVSHTGEWCCPCGYIDWDESLEEACIREVREETGLTLKEKDIRFFKATTDKHSRNQSINLWYVCWTNEDFDFDKIETKDEVYCLMWLKVKDGDKILTENLSSIEKWAFKNHKQTIVDMLN